MSHDVVYRDASWESDTSLKLLGFFVAEYLLQFFFHELVSFLANCVDVSSNYAKSHYFGKCSIYNLSSGLVFIEDCWSFNEVLILEFLLVRSDVLLVLCCFHHT